MNALCDNLTRAGKRCLPLRFCDGSRLVVLLFGGRLLGLFPEDSDENLLWTNPALATPGSTAELFAGHGWLNLGGDRTWLAPEIELFIGDPARPFQTYAVPPALDPGDWRVVAATDAEVCLATEAHLRLHRAKSDVGVRLSKCFRASTSPLAGTAVAGAVQYAGYRLTTTLEQEADASPRLGLWNLLQLPQPGTMLIPTRAPGRPRLVFGAVSEAELEADPAHVRWHMAGPGPDTKISLKPGVLRGRAGYLRRTACPGISALVVREFAVDVHGAYVDALWEPPHETGWAFEACCVRNGAARFNELEYHVPAPAPGSPGRDESHVWAFRGPEPAIHEAAALLLGGGSEHTA